VSASESHELSPAAGSVTILHYQGIGDTILSLPLLHWLRRRVPRHRVQVVAPRNRFGLYHGLADDLLTFSEARERLDEPGDVVDLDVVDLDTGTRDGRYHALVREIRCRRLVGFASDHAEAPRQGEWQRLEIGQMPIWRQYLSLGRCLFPGGGEVGDPRPPLVRVTAAAAARADERLATFEGRPLLGCAPGAGIAAKRWPGSGFAELAAGRVEEQGAAVVLIGAASDRSLAAPIFDRVAASDRADCFGWELADTAALLRRCTAVLANDSAMLHLAAAMGVPVVGLYGRYCSPQTHRPLGAAHTVLYTKRRHPSAIPVEEVAPHLARYLAGEAAWEDWRLGGRVVLL
jgi:ADP-heptose:LPS heptosyltransferase